MGNSNTHILSSLRGIKNLSICMKNMFYFKKSTIAGVFEDLNVFNFCNCKGMNCILSGWGKHGPSESIPGDIYGQPWKLRL